ncbi:MAG: single stranded DNA-binding domain-containing protein [Bacteroidia bacterium]
MIKQKRSLDKTDKELREMNFTKTRVSKAHLKLFTQYCKEQQISKYDALHEIITFLYETKMPISALNIQNVTHLIKNYHNYTSGVLKNFENSFLAQLDKNKEDNITFLQKSINLLLDFKTKENVTNTQNFKLLRALISTNVDDKDAKILLQETLLAVQDTEKTKPVNTGKEPFILEGRVGQNPKIEQSTKEKKLYLIFTLAQNSLINAQTSWHNVVLWEGALTQKLQLKDESAIKKYFSGIKTGDKLKLKGYNTEGKYKDKEQKNITKTTYVVTDVISHIPKKPIEDDNKA